MYYRYFISLELYSFGKNFKAQLAGNEDFHGLNSYFSL